MAANEIPHLLLSNRVIRALRELGVSEDKFADVYNSLPRAERSDSKRALEAELEELRAKLRAMESGRNTIIRRRKAS